MAVCEREIEQAILSQKRWADLDNRMRDLIGSSQEYDKKILNYSIENQLRYRGNLVRFVVNDEYEYYRNLLKHSRAHLMLFPYHLSDFVITGMRITPFQYYLSTMTQIIEQEKSYDTLPNFTAADCLRLLGIGRNQYIAIMNELRSTYRKFLGFTTKRSARSLLPNKPDENVPIEPWWFVNAGYITEDDVRSMVTTSERSIIDQLVSPDGLSNQILACNLDEAQVRSLYLKGLIYLDVPIYDDDFIVVPPLEGFVMNRVTGDYFETLLYKIFVSIDQNTPVSELATILDIDIRLIKNAVSMYCRLKFAHKKNIYIDVDKCHPSWLPKLDEYRKMGVNLAQQTNKDSKHISEFMDKLATIMQHDHGTEVVADSLVNHAESTYNFQDVTKSRLVQSPSLLLGPGATANTSISVKKIAFFYDSNLAAFLMMGNLSSKLKNHAVTMFEVGKLSDEWIDSLLEELSKIKGDTIEEDGFEAKRYYIHAIMLHRTIEFIRTDLTLASNLLRSTPESPDNGGSPSEQQQQQRVGLDLIRVESLSNLDTESCERFLKKNYQLIISVAPLNQDVKLSAATCLPHLGPGSPLINSLWFRMFIYYMTGYGPPSLLLLQGFRLTKLPEAFDKCDTLLLNHWNREPTCISSKNALNVINEALTHSPLLVQAYPVMPSGGNLINGEEKVFVPLPLASRSQEDQIIDGASEEEHASLETQAPDEDLENDPAVMKLAKCIDLTKVCGYITLLRSTESAKKLMQQNEALNCYGSWAARSQLDTSEPPADAAREEQPADSVDQESKSKEQFVLFDCHFGVPLFDRYLNKQVRTRISRQDLCKADSLQELVEKTHALNAQIDKFVSRYRSSASIASIDISDAGDTRHFFAFPETEQFRCPVPRPAMNVLFENGVLSTPFEGQQRE